MDLVVPMVLVAEVPVVLEVQAATEVAPHMADHRVLLALVGLVAQVALEVTGLQAEDFAQFDIELSAELVRAEELLGR